MRLRDKQTRVLETLPAPISKETAGFIKALPASTCSCMGDLLTDTQSFLEISESSEISLQGVSDAVNAVMGNTTLLDRIVVKGGQASTLKLRATARMFRAMLPVAPAVCTAIVSAAQTHAQQPGASLSLQLIFEFASSRSWIRDADYMSAYLSEDVLKLLALSPGDCLMHMTVVAKQFDQQCQEKHSEMDAMALYTTASGYHTMLSASVREPFLAALRIIPDSVMHSDVFTAYAEIVARILAGSHLNSTQRDLIERAFVDNLPFIADLASSEVFSTAATGLSDAQRTHLKIFCQAMAEGAMRHPGSLAYNWYQTVRLVSLGRHSGTVVDIYGNVSKYKSFLWPCVCASGQFGSGSDDAILPNLILLAESGLLGTVDEMKAFKSKPTPNGWCFGEDAPASRALFDRIIQAQQCFNLPLESADRINSDDATRSQFETMIFELRAILLKQRTLKPFLETHNLVLKRQHWNGQNTLCVYRGDTHQIALFFAVNIKNVYEPLQDLVLRFSLEDRLTDMIVALQHAQHRLAVAKLCLGRLSKNSFLNRLDNDLIECIAKHASTKITISAVVNGRREQLSLSSSKVVQHVKPEPEPASAARANAVTAAGAASAAVPELKVKAISARALGVEASKKSAAPAARGQSSTPKRNPRKLCGLCCGSRSALNRARPAVSVRPLEAVVPHIGSSALGDAEAEASQQSASPNSL